MPSNGKRRRSVRLPKFDYSTPGAYFITICTYQQEPLFGEIRDGLMHLSQWGELVETQWRQLPQHIRTIQLDEFIVMPNHFHAIIFIKPSVGAGFPRPAEWGAETAPLQKRTLGQIVAYFKYQATKRINILRGTPGITIWQRNYHERVVRDEQELNTIRKYIAENPLQWQSDDYYTVRPDPVAGV